MDLKQPEQSHSVGIGIWKVARSPDSLRAILGSCMGVVIYDAANRIGGMAHILLPDSRGSKDNPGRYADTALPAMIEELNRARNFSVRNGLVAKLAGGAKMFETQSSTSIGEANHQAVRRQLEALRIRVVSEDIGGDTGRNVTFETSTGRFFVRRPGGKTYEIL